ncbi:hypothetical protein [Nitrospina watsonii]|uniref:CN hydrolase domain-containing protein n=1 Tax=Nitrospina watsonii TaxID=1323948 RepID=A0ABM9HH17_9BACT|nr:hypothetical protein [Nitrospina watsonii]CAI2719324.1 conserved protein of unknown function [Nitrospina watsonii]
MSTHVENPAMNTKPLEVNLCTFGMAAEDKQLAEIAGQVEAANAGDIYLFPEYAAYTAEGSDIAYDALCRWAREKRITLITTLNRAAADLPHADASERANTLFVFSRDGTVHAPQAKVTPQSFEMNWVDEKSPVINVKPYAYLNRVVLRHEGQACSALFLICSDLYLLKLFPPEALKADVLFCPANFGNGAEGVAGRLIETCVERGVFGQAFYANCYQKPKGDHLPLTVAVTQSYRQVEGAVVKMGAADLVRQVDASHHLYHDDSHTNFLSMLELTRQGGFTVPHSRSVESGLSVHSGIYDRVIEI